MIARPVLLALLGLVLTVALAGLVEAESIGQDRTAAPADTGARTMDDVPAPTPPPLDLGAPPAVRGVALGLFADSPDHDYRPQLEEIAALGASHVAIVATWFQHDVHATEIVADERRTPSRATLIETLRAADRLGLDVMLFPYVRVDVKHGPSDWRGTLAPSDREAWYQEYEAWIVGLARLAARERVEILSVGSEMSSMDVDTERWRAILRAVRQVYPAPGRITYSSNWDHFDRVEFWDAVDLIGLTGYFELVAPDRTDPTDLELVEGWREWYVRLMRWQSHHDRPLLMTEVGYRSNDGAAAYPWRWGTGEDRVDLDEQRALYEAFARVWSDEPRLGGAFFWNWWGEGGPACHDYTPRGKPAELVLRRWFGGRLRALRGAR